VHSSLVWQSWSFSVFVAVRDTCHYSTTNQECTNTGSAGHPICGLCILCLLRHQSCYLCSSHCQNWYISLSISVLWVGSAFKSDSSISASIIQNWNNICPYHIVLSCQLVIAILAPMATSSWRTIPVLLFDRLESQLSERAFVEAGKLDKATSLTLPSCLSYMERGHHESVIGTFILEPILLQSLQRIYWLFIDIGASCSLSPICADFTSFKRINRRLHSISAAC